MVKPYTQLHRRVSPEPTHGCGGVGVGPLVGIGDIGGVGGLDVVIWCGGYGTLNGCFGWVGRA